MEKHFIFLTCHLQIKYLLHCGVLEPMCNMLTVKDANALLVLMDGFKNILLSVEKADNGLDMDLVCDEIDTHKGKAIS